MSKLPRVLLLDDDPAWLRQAPMILEDVCEVEGYATIDQGLQAIAAHFYDLILLDINFDGDSRSGLDVFRMIQAADRGAEVIVISGETRPDRLIQIMNAGVTHFLIKPVPPDEVIAAVKSVLEQRDLRLRAHNLLKTGDAGNLLIGQSIAMKKLREEVGQIVASEVKDILIIGETGTGKEVVASAIAYQADPAKRFIPIHCGAISDGLAESELFGHVKGAFTGGDKDRAGAFEIAGGGFVFLDEIGDMPLAQQAKLLRVLQERKVQRVGSHDERPVAFRSISATNVDMEQAILQKRFREDLYYRIAKAKIRIPPLRDRIEDIPELVHNFLAEVSGKKSIMVTNDAFTLLQTYHWPGNVRQLKAAIESMCTRTDCGVIREKDVCQAIPQAASVFGNRIAKTLVGRYGATLVSKERNRFESAIIESRGDRDEAARLLGLSRSTFYRRAKELGIVKERRSRTPEMQQ
jgi:DNA-binding NtrC family response regulator